MSAVRKLLKETMRISRFDLAFASNLRRAIEGARIVVGADAKITEIPEFAEVDFGDFEGLTSDEIRERMPHDFARWNRDRLSPEFTYPHGENRAAFAARVEHGFERMLAITHRVCGKDWTTLVVAHRGVIRAIMQRITTLEPVIELGSIQLVMRSNGTQWRAEEIDRVAPLDR
jgi:probable phosphoglycerate mutase